ncbi:MAG: ABC transporter ATP-binding protein, partial [Phenylobacterium sp.]|nr:ABC transporter ATP-binding protein [Phenylobacterium sp.]
MSDSRPSPRDAAADSVSIDVSAMPRVLRRIMGLALRYPGLVALAVGCSIGAALFSLTLPRLFGQAVDQAHLLLAGGSASADDVQRALINTALLVLGAASLRGLLTGYGGYVAEKVSQKVAYDLRLSFFQQLQRLSFGFHDKIHSGDLVTRGMLDLEGTRAFIQGGMMQTLTLVMLLSVSAFMMFSTDVTMAFLALAFVPIAGWFLARMGFLLRVTWLRVQQLMSVLTLTMEENLQGIRVVRAFSAKAFEMGKFDVAADNALQYSFKRITLRFRAITAMTLSYYGSMAMLLWYGGHQVIAGAMSVGRLTEFLTYMTLLQAPIRQIAMIFASAARATS